MKKIVVIGGGAAGMLAAVAAANNGNRVVLLEKNEKLGKKIFITGKGRCNVTNAAGPDTFFANICSNPKFLYSAYASFDNKALMALLQDAGCALKIERGERVFPVSDHAYDVTDAFKNLLRKRKVDVRLHTQVTELLTKEEIPVKTEDSFGNTKLEIPRICGVKLSSGEVLLADAVIVCTGGLSYPTTGATGDGYVFAAQTGHRLVPQTPGLVPLETKEDWPKQLQGLSLKNVTFTLKGQGKKPLYQGFGEMLFTHFGVSGPLVLSASSKMKGDFPFQAQIDLKPALNEEQLLVRIEKDLAENKNKHAIHALSGLFPARLTPIMLQLAEIVPTKKACEVSKAEKQRLLTLIKHLPLTVTGTRGFAEAIITKGGVSVKDISPSTMESKKVKGLYFAGEVLDLDAFTGGFNLQVAFSTGFLAGKSAGEAGDFTEN